MFELDVAERWVGDRQHYFVNWQTDDLIGSAVYIRPLGEADYTIFSSSAIDSVHSIDITSYLEYPASDHEFYLSLDIESGSPILHDNNGQLFKLSDFVDSINLRTISSSDFNQVTTLPDGHFLDKYTDFDQDGWPELAVMTFGNSPL